MYYKHNMVLWVNFNMFYSINTILFWHLQYIHIIYILMYVDLHVNYGQQYLCVLEMQ